ncbi:MAG TPA: type II toxin-antitoxin system PemK/MazF family toxin [Chthonomonadaceae bacterium]|nr:type II toxin-antitoxin system PemK/MazF family toxin [Chthonomonadaceae bacterium]
MAMQPLRGEIWNVQFNPSVGAEIQKVRPAVVMNVSHVGRLPLYIVVPVTDWKPIFAHASWFVPLTPTPENGLSKASGADAFQVKSVSETRFLQKLGELSEEEVEAIAAAIALCIGYEPTTQK